MEYYGVLWKMITVIGGCNKHINNMLDHFIAIINMNLNYIDQLFSISKSLIKLTFLSRFRQKSLRGQFLILTNQIMRNRRIAKHRNC